MDSFERLALCLDDAKFVQIFFNINKIQIASSEIFTRKIGSYHFIVWLNETQMNEIAKMQIIQQNSQEPLQYKTRYNTVCVATCFTLLNSVRKG